MWFVMFGQFFDHGLDFIGKPASNPAKITIPLSPNDPLYGTMGPDGQPVPVTVKEIKEKTVVIDMNHPMAGKNLVFDIKILDVQPAAAASVQPAPPAQAAKPPQPK